MAINYMEIQPSEHAVKDIRGWVDSRTGEVLVAAYGYFTGDALKQQGQRRSVYRLSMMASLTRYT